MSNLSPEQRESLRQFVDDHVGSWASRIESWGKFLGWTSFVGIIASIVASLGYLFLFAESRIREQVDARMKDVMQKLPEQTDLLRSQVKVLQDEIGLLQEKRKGLQTHIDAIDRESAAISSLVKEDISSVLAKVNDAKAKNPKVFEDLEAISNGLFLKELEKRISLDFSDGRDCLTIKGRVAIEPGSEGGGPSLLLKGTDAASLVIGGGGSVVAITRNKIYMGHGGWNFPNTSPNEHQDILEKLRVNGPPPYEKVPKAGVVIQSGSPSRITVDGTPH